MNYNSKTIEFENNSTNIVLGGFLQMLTTSSSWSVQKRIRRSFQLTLDDLFLTILKPFASQFYCHFWVHSISFNFFNKQGTYPV